MAEIKTNVMRVLEQKKVPYTPHEYPRGDKPVDGVTVARLIGQNPDHVFKTLVTVGASGRNYVFVIPVAKELHLKKAAKAAGEKSLQMLPLNQLTPLTGYVRGGCSPVGMKKSFPIFFDIQAESIPTILVSAGRIGSQIETRPQDLITLVKGHTADVT